MASPSPPPPLPPLAQGGRGHPGSGGAFGLWSCCASVLRSQPDQMVLLGPALARQVPTPHDKDHYHIWGIPGCSVHVLKTNEERAEPLMAKAKTAVILHVYNIGHSQVVQRLNKMTQDFLATGGVFHGAIEVYHQEWSFGSTKADISGIYRSEPKECSMHEFRESIFLGDCQKEPRELAEILHSMKAEWMGRSYDLLDRNCCHFSDALAQKLGVGEIPHWVNRLAHIGSQLRHAKESLHGEIRAGLDVLHVVGDHIEEDAEEMLDYLRWRHPRNWSPIADALAACDRELPVSKVQPQELISLGPAFAVPRASGFECFLGVDHASSSEGIHLMMSQAVAPVTLHVYTVGHSKAIRRLSRMTQDFLHWGGVFHGAVEVYDFEWSFGSAKADVCGIFSCEPERCPMHTYRESVYLGDCRKTPQEVHDILSSMKPEWMGRTYDLFDKNCCDFSGAFAQLLGVGRIPRSVNRLAHIGGSLRNAGEVVHEELEAGLRGLHHVYEYIDVEENLEAALNILRSRRSGRP